MVHRPSFAEINLSNLKHNAELMYEVAGQPKFFCPMVKANAYGHGAIHVSKTLLQTHLSHLGVGLIEEAVHLRENQIEAPLLFFGLFDSQSSKALIKNKITPVISAYEELEILRKELSANQKIKIHLKFNTGMNRLGLEISEIPKLRKFLDENKNFDLEGTCTHLLVGEDAGSDGDSFKQLEKFFEADKSFQDKIHFRHALNSSAAANLYLREKHLLKSVPPSVRDLGARPGISLYGGEVATQEVGKLDLRPVMSLKSKLAMLHKVKKGEVVSYGGRWRAPVDSLVGVVPIGYADGYFRNLTNSGEVLCHGFKVPVVGTVCMDYFMIDLTAIVPQNKIEIGDEVVLFGKQKDKQILASDLAKKVGTISYEVLARISERVPRIYIV